MKIDRINYQKTFNLGNYTSERIGMEAEIDSMDDPAECLNYLKEKVESYHKENNPQIQFDPELNAPSQTIKWDRHEEPFKALPTPPPAIDYKAIEKLEIAIDNAESLVELETYKDEANKHGLGGHYDARLLNFKHGSHL